MNVLTLDHVHVSVGGRLVLRDLELAVAPGEIIGILGANGAGKTSLLRAISGELPASGNIMFAGRPLPEWTLRERARRLGALPQFSVLNFPYTVEEVVALGRVPHATGAAVNRTIIEEVMTLLDVAALGRTLYTRLSGGEKRRVQVARVLAQIWGPWQENEPAPRRLLLLDEPAAALDLLHRQYLLRAFEQLRAQGTAVLVVEHDLNFAITFADRLVALAAGGIIAEGNAEQVITTDILRRLYRVDAHVLQHPTSGRPLVAN